MLLTQPPTYYNVKCCSLNLKKVYISLEPNVKGRLNHPPTSLLLVDKFVSDKVYLKWRMFVKGFFRGTYLYFYDNTEKLRYFKDKIYVKIGPIVLVSLSQFTE